jgi:hypothetical protein
LKWSDLRYVLTSRRTGNGKEVKRLKELELENSRLRKAVSDLTLDKLILQEAARGKVRPLTPESYAHK